MSNWVWYSTEDSRAEGKVSILAIVETLFFVLLTWGVAFYFNFYYYLFFPLVLTPFLMLKTPESVEQSHRMFLYELDTYLSSKKFILFVCGLVTFVLFAILFWHTNQSYSFLLAAFFIILLFVLWFVITMMTASGKNAIEKSVNEFFRENKRTAILSSFILATFFYFTDKFDLSSAIAMFVTASLATFFWSGISSGFVIFFRSLMIKIFATLSGILMRPMYTLEHLPKNWREQVFVNDICYTPELLPDIRKHNPDFQLIGLLQGNSHIKDILEKFFRYILAFFWSLAYLYRWSIKSTAWFYWPLAFVLNKKPLEDKIKAKTLIDDQTNPLTLKGHIGLSAILLIYFMGSTVSLDKIENVESSVGVVIKLFQAIAINHPVVKTIIQPDTWWLVLSATLIYFVIYGFSSVQQYRRSHNNPEYSEMLNVILHWLIRLKNVLWITFFAVNLFFIANQHVWPLIFNSLRSM